MGLQIRREVVKGKSKKLPDRTGMVVTGPMELFSNDIMDKLAIAGFRKVNSRNERGDIVWRLPASLAATPDHLLKTLSTVAFVDGDAAMRRAVEMGTAPWEGEGAGVAELKIGVIGDFFCANCTTDNKRRRYFLEGAGMFPLFPEGVTTNPVITKAFGNCPYVTQDGVIAANVLPWMNADAKKLLLDRMREEKMRIARSSVKQRIKGDPVIPMPEGESLQGFQDAGVNNMLRSKKSGVIYDDMGLGKAQPLFSMIITPYGKKLMGDIKVGDQVMGSEGTPVTVTGVFPQGKKEIFKVTFSDGASTHCCDEHLWAVNSSSRKRLKHPWKIMTLSEMDQNLKDKHGLSKYYIPMISPVQYEEKTLPVPPYLLGVLLGDGGISRNCIRITTADDEILNHIKMEIPEGLQIRHIQRYDYGIVAPTKLRGSNPLTGSLRALDLMGRTSDDKFIPPMYLLSSVKQRLALLQGLLDTDGSVSLKNCVKFSSNSKALAEGVVEIVQSLGGAARIKKYISASGKDHHHVTIILPDRFKPFRLARKLERCRVKYKKPSRAIIRIESIGCHAAQCISVDSKDHLYATDQYILTHNTVQGIAYANARPDLPRILVVSKANMKFGWKTSFDRFGVRPHNAFVINGTSKHVSDPKTGEIIGFSTPQPHELVPSGVEGPHDPALYDLVIINYDILSDHEEFIRNTVWDLIIMDEIHSVSNEEAIRTRTLFGDLKDPVKKPVPVKTSKRGVKLGLSGTPHPVVERMWPILSSMRPDVFGSGPYAKRLFINRYAPPTLFEKEFKKGNSTWKKIMSIPGRPVRQAELNRRLRGSGFMTRRLKADMVDFLPPKSRAAIELPFQLTPEETKELAQLEGQIMTVLANVAGRTVDGVAQVKNAGQAKAIIDVVKGLRPKSPEFHEISRLRSRIGEIKAPYVADYVIAEADGEEDLPPDIRPKTVIFAHHKAVVASIRDALEARYPGQVIVYDGSVTSDKKRFELEKKFQTDDKIRFFVMSLSGASGITLTRANRLYMAEMDWDPTNLPQIEDRIWRMTQELPCFIGYFMIPNSLDVQMGNKLIEKMEDNRLIYDEIDLRPGVKVKAETGFKKVTPAADTRQGKLF